MNKLQLYYESHNDDYKKDLISIYLLIGIMLISALYIKNLLIISISIGMVFLRVVYIYKNRLKDVSKSEINPITIQNAIMDLIMDIDVLLKGLDVEIMDDLYYKNLKHISDKLNFYNKNVNNILDIVKLNKIHKDLITIREDIILIMNGEFVQPRNQNNVDGLSYSDEDKKTISSYLSILGLGDNIRDEDTIKLAYRTLSKKYHPDKNKSPEARMIFEKIKNAYENLKTLLKIQ